MSEKLDRLERELSAMIAASAEIAAETTLERWQHRARVGVERRWRGQARWIYVTAIEEGTAVGGDEYMLFLGWYSDPPGKTYWEGRTIGDLRHTLRLVEAWVLRGVAPEEMPRHPHWGV